MKTNRKNIILTLALASAVIMVNIPSTVYATTFSNGEKFLTEFFNMTEDDIYAEKSKDAGHELIVEIRELEKEFINDSNKIALIPHATALIDKKDDFTSEEIFALLKDGGNGEVLESALIQMYILKEDNNDELLELIESGTIHKSSNDYIVAKSNYTPSQLATIIENNNDSVAVVAMKKLMVDEPEKAFAISTNILSNPLKNNITDEKMWVACLGIGEYYSQFKNSNTQKQDIVEEMKRLYDATDSDFLKDKIIYSLSNMEDFDVFAYIINNEHIDDILKVSAIERNVELLVHKAKSKMSQEELDCIVTAMEIHPILDVGKVLQQSVESGMVLAKQDLSNTIKYIENNGIEGVYKYD